MESLMMMLDAARLVHADIVATNTMKDFMDMNAVLRDVKQFCDAWRKGEGFQDLESGMTAYFCDLDVCPYVGGVKCTAGLKISKELSEYKDLIRMMAGNAWEAIRFDTGSYAVTAMEMNHLHGGSRSVRQVLREQGLMDRHLMPPPHPFPRRMESHHRI